MMPRLRRLSRRTSLRLLAVLGLVLSVVFFNPLAATAATSGTMTFNMGTGGLGDTVPINNVTCQIPWSVNSGGMVLGSSSRCDGGPDISPGMCQPYEGSCGSYGFVLKDGTGGTCGGTALSPFDIGGGITGVKAGLGGGYVAFSDSCQPVEACLSYYYDPPVGGTTDFVTCVSVDLDDAGSSPDGSCPHGAPSSTFATLSQVADGYYITKYFQKVRVTGVTPFVGSAGTGWNFTIMLTENATEGVGYNTQPDPSDDYQKIVRGQNQLNEDPAPNWQQPHGVQVWYSSPDYPNSGDQNGSVYSAYKPTTGFMGQTDPSLCRFWFGPKIYEDPNSQRDEPFGGIGPSVEEPPPTVVPPDTDTPGDDLGLLAAILAMLRAIAGAIGALLNAIGRLVQSILDGLVGLFVPDQGFLDSKIDQLSDSADGTTLGNYLDALSGLAPAGSAGCEGPAVSIPVMGNNTTAHPLSACSGGLSQLASASRVIVGVSAGLAAGFACVRILGRGFGWDPGLGGQS